MNHRGVARSMSSHSYPMFSSVFEGPSLPVAWPRAGSTGIAIGEPAPSSSPERGRKCALTSQSKVTAKAFGSSLNGCFASNDIPVANSTALLPESVTGRRANILKPRPLDSEASLSKMFLQGYLNQERSDPPLEADVEDPFGTSDGGSWPRNTIRALSGPLPGIVP